MVRLVAGIDLFADPRVVAGLADHAGAVVGGVGRARRRDRIRLARRRRRGRQQERVDVVGDAHFELPQHAGPLLLDGDPVARHVDLQPPRPHPRVRRAVARLRLILGAAGREKVALGGGPLLVPGLGVARLRRRDGSPRDAVSDVERAHLVLQRAELDPVVPPRNHRTHVGRLAQVDHQPRRREALADLVGHVRRVQVAVDGEVAVAAVAAGDGPQVGVAQAAHLVLRPLLRPLRRHGGGADEQLAEHHRAREVGGREVGVGGRLDAQPPRRRARRQLGAAPDPVGDRIRAAVGARRGVVEVHRPAVGARPDGAQPQPPLVVGAAAAASAESALASGLPCSS